MKHLDRRGSLARDEPDEARERAEVLLGDLVVLHGDPVALLDLADELDDTRRVDHAELEETVLVGQREVGLKVQEVLVDVLVQVVANAHYHSSSQALRGIARCPSSPWSAKRCGMPPPG